MASKGRDPGCAAAHRSTGVASHGSRPAVSDTSLTLCVIVRVPAEGVALFQAYEARVLPLLADHGGRLERRLRTAGQTMEVHILRFSSAAGFAAFRADPRRAALAGELARSGAVTEVVEVTDVV